MTTFGRHTFAQVLDILTDLSPNCIHLKFPLSLGLHPEIVLSNNWIAVRDYRDSVSCLAVRLRSSFHRFLQISDCCLKNLTTYLNPLGECLFHRPKRNTSTSEEVGNDNMVVGERTLSEKVKNISREAKLSSVTQTIQISQGDSCHNP